MAAPSSSGSYALEDYQMQLMLLEQQNQKRQMMARQEQDATSVERNNSPLLDPRFYSARQSDLRHGLLTPGATPPNPSSLTPSNSPLSRNRMSNTPSFDPRFTGKIRNDPSLYPHPFQPQQTFQYSTSKHTPPSYYSNVYQEYLEPPQTTQFPTSNAFEWARSFSTPTCFPEAQVTWAPELDPRCSASSRSEVSMESMISPDTNDTVDHEVMTPGDWWDGLLEFTSPSTYETKYTASTDSNFSLEFRSAELLSGMEQSLNDCFGALTSPPNENPSLAASGTSNFNLGSHSSQALTDTPGMTTQLCPLKQPESPPNKESTVQILSNVLEEHEQSAVQPRDITGERRTEHRESQIRVSEDCNTLSKPNCETDIRTSVEAQSSPCATRSVSNTTSGQDLPYYRRQTSSPSPMTASESETCPWSSDNDTDWGDDESDDGHRIIGTSVIIEGSNTLLEQGLPNLVSKPVLSKMKQELVDRLMVEFWQIFNQEQEINRNEDHIAEGTRLHQYQEPDTRPQDEQNTTSTSKSSTISDVQINGTRPISGQNGKRKRQGQDDDENDETEDRNPKRPKGLLSPPRNLGDTSKFACPYRKHDPRTYCVRHWRSCALTPLETVARVKGHLYRHHRIFPCQRCKALFNDQQEVNDHLKEPKGCELLESVHQDGITNEIVEKLRSKKKAHRDQSEEDRWKEIYQILFPGEMVISPFFEEIQEDVIQSPDSRELADYEEYCRRELPRVFRTSLEEVVNNNTQPLEEQLRSQLMDLIRDAQDRVFSSYRSSSSTATGTPARGAPNSSSQSISSSSLSQEFLTSPLRSQPTIGSSGIRHRPRLPAFFEPPSPQIHLESGLDISDRNITPSKPDRNNRSDSGYDSSSFVLPPTLPITPGDSTVTSSTSSSQTLPLLEMNQKPAGHSDNEVALTQAGLDSNAEAISVGGNGDLNSEVYLQQNRFDFDLDSVNLPNFDMDGFGDCDFSQNLDGFL